MVLNGIRDMTFKGLKQKNDPKKIQISHLKANNLSMHTHITTMWRHRGERAKEGVKTQKYQSTQEHKHKIKKDN